MKQGIILRGCQRQFENFTDEIRHQRAATAALRLKMRHIWNRHDVGKVERLIPVLISIHRSSTKSSGAKSFCVKVDLFSSLKEFFLVLKQFSIVIQIVNVHLEASFSEAFQEIRASVVTHFRNDLKR